MRVSGFVDRRRAVTYAWRVHAVLDVLEQLPGTGRADDIVACAEHVMARLDTAMSSVDDSNGYLDAVISRVQDLHHAACVAARPDPRRFGVRLVEFELKTDWEWFLDAPERYREVLGDEGLAAYRTRAVALAQRAFDAEPSARTYAELREATSGFHQTNATRARRLLSACGL
jgi:hypothetical protein